MRILPFKSYYNSRIISFIVFSFISILIFYMSLNAHFYGSDVGRIWQTSKMLIEEGYNYPVNTLMPLLSTTVYSIFFVFFGYDFPLPVISGLFTILALMLIWRFVYEETDLNIATISLLFILLATPIFAQSYDARPYAMAIFLIMLSIYMLNKYIYVHSKSKYLIFSAIFLTMAVYTQNLFLMGIGIPLLFFILSSFSSNKIFKKTIVQYYIVVLLLLIPWVIYRFNIAGFDLYKAPYTWMYSEGLWSKINIYLYNRPVPGSEKYYTFFINNLYDTINYSVMLFFLIVGLFKVKNRIYIAWIVMFLVPIILGKVPTQSRYLYPVIFPMILLVSVGISNIIKILNAKSKIILIFTLIILLSPMPFIIIENFEDFNQENRINKNELSQFGYYINPGGAIYFRSHIIAPIFPDNRVYSVTDLEYYDAIELITWQSDYLVTTTLDKYNIKWIILYQDRTHWEQSFHSWTRIAVGRPPTHYIKIDKSSDITKIAETNHYILYKYK